MENLMSLKAKYQPVIDLIKEMNSQISKIKEENSTLIISGSVKNKHEKEIILNKIQQLNSEGAVDIDIQLRVESHSG